MIMTMISILISQAMFIGTKIKVITTVITVDEHDLRNDDNNNHN